MAVAVGTLGERRRAKASGRAGTQARIFSDRVRFCVRACVCLFGEGEQSQNCPGVFFVGGGVRRALGNSNDNDKRSGGRWTRRKKKKRQRAAARFSHKEKEGQGEGAGSKQRWRGETTGGERANRERKSSKDDGEKTQKDSPTRTQQMRVGGHRFYFFYNKKKRGCGNPKQSKRRVHDGTLLCSCALLAGGLGGWWLAWIDPRYAFDRSIDPTLIRCRISTTSKQASAPFDLLAACWRPMLETSNHQRLNVAVCLLLQAHGASLSRCLASSPHSTTPGRRPGEP